MSSLCWGFVAQYLFRMGRKRKIRHKYGAKIRARTLKAPLLDDGLVINQLLLRCFELPHRLNVALSNLFFEKIALRRAFHVAHVEIGSVDAL